jgi:RNA polymerase sigma-70 factor (ECF subfamily)
LYVRVRENELAQDLTQEVFMRVLRSIRALEYRGEKLFLGWLYTITNNVLIGHMRRKRAITAPLDERIEIVDPRGQDEVLAISDRLMLQQALNRLTDDQQQVLTLKFFGGLSNQEIAHVLRRSEGAIKALQHRALNTMHEILTAEDREVLAARAVGES